MHGYERANLQHKSNGRPAPLIFARIGPENIGMEMVGRMR